MGRTLDSKDDVITFDNLNFINRVEKGKRALLYCLNCTNIFTVPRHDNYDCELCENISIRVKHVLNYIKEYSQTNNRYKSDSDLLFKTDGSVMTADDMNQKALFDAVVLKLRQILHRCTN